MLFNICVTQRLKLSYVRIANVYMAETHVDNLTGTSIVDWLGRSHDTKSIYENMKRERLPFNVAAAAARTPERIALSSAACANAAALKWSDGILQDTAKTSQNDN